MGDLFRGSSYLPYIPIFTTMKDFHYARPHKITQRCKFPQELLDPWAPHSLPQEPSSLRGYNLQPLEIQWRTTSDQDSYYEQNSHYKDSYSIDIEVIGSSLCEKTRDLKFDGSRKTFSKTLLKMWKWVGKLLFSKTYFKNFASKLLNSWQKTLYNGLFIENRIRPLETKHSH